ncbi:MAG: WD40 repeat domain-containing protein [Campylobacterota bacterium]|nr:WD40 repeat domain-containing protein [Campylobacterota bacterium]
MGKLSIELKEKFYIFDSFLISNEHILKRGDGEWDSSKILFQLAMEHADSSPLSKDAQSYEDKAKVDFDYVCDLNRDEEIYISPLVKVLDGDDEEIFDLVILKNGNIASIFEDNTIKIFDPLEYALIYTIEQNQNKELNQLKQLRDGHIISYSDYYNNFQLWDKDSYNEIKVSEGDEYYYESLAISNKVDSKVKNHKRLTNGDTLSISYDGSLAIFDKNNEVIIAIQEAKSVQVLNTGDILFATDDNIFRILEKESYKLIEEFKETKSLKIFDNDIFLQKNGGTFEVWDIKQLQCKVVIEEYKDIMEGFEILDSKNIVFYSNDESISVMNIDNPDKVQFLEGHESKINGLKLLGNGCFLSFSNDGIIAVWDSDSYENISVLEDHLSGVRSIEILLNGNIVVLSKDFSLRVWNMQNYRCESVLHGHTGEIKKIEILLNGNIASYSHDKTIKIWDKDSYKFITTIKDQNDILGIECLEHNDLVSYKIVTSSDKQEKKWDENTIVLKNGNKLSIYAGKMIIWDKTPQDYLVELGKWIDMTNITILDNGNILEVASSKITIWDFNSGEIIFTINENKYIRQVKEFENYLLYVSDKIVKIFDKKSSKIIGVLQGHEDSILDFKRLDNGNIITYSKDKTMRVWDINNIKYANKQETKDLEIKQDDELSNFGEFELENEDSIKLDNGNFLKTMDNENWKQWNSSTVAIYDSNDNLISTLDENIDIMQRAVLEILKNGNIIICQEERIRIWEKDIYNCVIDIEVEFHIAAMKELENDMIVFSAYNEIYFYLIDIKNNKVEYCQNSDVDSNYLYGDGADFKLFKNGNLLSFYPGEKQHIEIWDMQSFISLHILDCEDENIVGVGITEDDNIITYSKDNVLKEWNIDDNSQSIITKDKVHNYYKSLPSFEKILDDENYIYENYFNEYYLSVFDQKTKQTLQWHSNYKPKVNRLYNGGVVIDDLDSKRALKINKNWRKL